MLITGQLITPVHLQKIGSLFISKDEKATTYSKQRQAEHKFQHISQHVQHHLQIFDINFPTPSAPQEWIYDAHYNLAHLPRHQFSLSHTEQVMVSWLCPASIHGDQGWGVDVESKNRQISDRVERWLKRQKPKDREGQDALQGWCRWEAHYKASSKLPTLDPTLTAQYYEFSWDTYHLCLCHLSK